uniref:ATP binding protein n=1 Tax=Arundo donax TaxID=35708 RepID=A0A0A8YP45_ARUDO
MLQQNMEVPLRETTQPDICKQQLQFSYKSGPEKGKEGKHLPKITRPSSPTVKRNMRNLVIKPDNQVSR